MGGQRLAGIGGVGPLSRSGVLVLLLVTVLAACSWRGGGGASTSAPSSSPTPATGPEWALGLARAANGPVPVIVVDQFGYRPRDAKVAVLRSPVTGYDTAGDYRPGPRIEVVDADTGTVVRTGSAAAWHGGDVDTASGDRAWWFDFSDLRDPGSYFVRDPARGVRSGTFDIAPRVYEPVLRAALRTFFYQRAGQEKTQETAGAWQDKASHLGPDQDPAARSWLAQDDASTARDLRGGWYDAGDYTKYTSWHAGYVLALLQTHREHPDLIGDDLGIPESGNGVSDLLDEIDWGLSWLVRAQQPDGSVISIERLDQASPPSAARGPSYYGPPTTHATQRAAAALAFASTVYAESGSPRLAARSADLVRRAQAAWAWSSAHPRAIYYNNDESQQPGSGGLGGGQQETDDAGRVASRVEAATYLYGATGDAQLRQYVLDHRESYLPRGSQTQWNVDRQEVLLHFAGLPGVPAAVRAEIRADFRRALETSALFLPALATADDPYQAPIQQYTWGSNQSKSQVGRMFALAAAHGLDRPLSRAALTAAEGYLHYVHGVNPLGLVYLTTMTDAGAEHSATTLYHMWFADGTRWDAVTESTPGPAPGFLVGGPNPYYSLDRCCAGSPSCGDDSDCSGQWQPPLGQPPMKSYLQFNDGWPINSWEVTENSNGYQVAYIRLLAAFVQ